MSNPIKKFNIQAKLDLLVSIEISARTLEEALLKSKELEVDDFININGEHLDSEMQITGIY